MIDVQDHQRQRVGRLLHPRCPQFMAGLCDVKVPPDFEPEPEHFVKCWLYQ